jgi:hypothetical protein
VQLTHEFINPAWPAAIVRRLSEQMVRSRVTLGVKITSLITGPYGGLNHFGHPDAGVSQYHVDWFKGLVDISVDLGRPSLGTQFAIQTYRDYADPDRRKSRMSEAPECWRAVAGHAEKRGPEFLFWEPMSVGHAIGHTIEDPLKFHSVLDAAGLAVPLKAMIDIDYGDVSSLNPADTDPYAWAKAFAAPSPIIRITQSSTNKGGHWPFAADHNRVGRIASERLIETIWPGGGGDNELCMEFAFREREPADRNVIAMIRESVSVWEPYADVGRSG